MNDNFAEVIKNTYEALGIAVLNVRMEGNNTFYVDIIDHVGPRTLIATFLLVSQDAINQRK